MIKKEKNNRNSEFEEYLNNKLSTYLDILKEMVDINSYTENREGVNRLADYTEEIFKPLGFFGNRIKSINSNYGDHLILSRKGKTDKSIASVSHLDTVFPPEEEIANNFKWRIEGDQIYGPGTNDVKGGTVLIYMVLDALHTVAPEILDSINWSILLDASEETDSSDFAELCRKHLNEKTLACLVFEGGGVIKNEFNLITARKGRNVFKIDAIGRGAHSGVDHHTGVNAIVQLGEIIDKVDSLNNYENELTVNIGSISGGGQVNRVPQFASMDVEVRAFSPSILKSESMKILNYHGYSSKDNHIGDFKANISVSKIQECPPWPANEGSEKIFEIWESAANEIGYKVKKEKRGGLSDGNYLWDYVPTMDGLGPAGENAHCSEKLSDGSKDQEFAYLSSFIPKTLLNLKGIINLIEKSK